MPFLPHKSRTGLGILLLQIFLCSPSSADTQTIKAKIGGGLYQGPRQFIVVDIDGQAVKARYTENVTTWCPMSCPWYDHFAIAYKACPIKKPDDFSPVEDSSCITSAGDTIIFPDDTNPENYSILFKYKKGGITQMQEFSINALRERSNAGFD